MNIEQLKTEAEKWYGITMMGSILQTGFFVAWVTVLLVISNAPFWGWIIGMAYVFSHVFHFLTWAIAQNAAKQYRDASDAEAK